MENLKVNAYLDKCRLTINLENGTSNTYLILFNTNTESVSDITKIETTQVFDLKEDGIYEIYIFTANSGLDEDGNITISGEKYDSKLVVDRWDGLKMVLNPYFFDTMFCICNLKRCLVDLQLKVFGELLKNCGSSKCKSNEAKAQRDFVFIAVWLMEHLAELGKEDLLREVFNSIQSCSSICGNLVKSKNCGCHA